MSRSKASRGSIIIIYVICWIHELTVIIIFLPISSNHRQGCRSQRVVTRQSGDTLQTHWWVSAQWDTTLMMRVQTQTGLSPPLFIKWKYTTGFILFGPVQGAFSLQLLGVWSHEWRCELGVNDWIIHSFTCVQIIWFLKWCIRATLQMKGKKEGPKQKIH